MPYSAPVLRLVGRTRDLVLGFTMDACAFPEGPSGGYFKPPTW